MNMNIDLNRLIIETNKKYTGNDPNLINFLYLYDNCICVSKGGKKYFINNEDLNNILTNKEVDLKNEDKVYDVLANHISENLQDKNEKMFHPNIAKNFFIDFWKFLTKKRFGIVYITKGFLK